MVFGPESSHIHMCGQCGKWCRCYRFSCEMPYACGRCFYSTIYEKPYHLLWVSETIAGVWGGLKCFLGCHNYFPEETRIVRASAASFKARFKQCQRCECIRRVNGE